MFSFRSQFKRSRRNYPIPKKTGINDILSALFQNNEQGLIYHIGDFDRYMSELGPELVTGINSAAAWTPYGSNIVENDSGAVKITFVNGSDGAYAYLGSGALSTNLTVGRTYAISGLAKVSAGSSVNISSNSGYGVGLNHATISSTEYVRFTFSILSSSPSLNLLKFLNMGVGESIWVTDISIRELTAISTATLFQDAAGTIPVTAVEQPVGLILDKSKGLVLGPELCTGNNLSTLLPSTNSSKTDTSFTTTVGGAGVLRDNIFEIGKWYSLNLSGTTTASEITVNSAPARYAGRTVLRTVLRTGFGAVVFRAAESNLYIRHSTAGTTSDITISIRELPGNHASQATTTARGVLRARYNLLTYSEDFSNPAWIKNVGINVIGTKKLVPTTASGIHKTTNTQASGLNNVSGQFTMRFRAKADGYNIIAPWFDNASVGARFNVSNGTVVSSAGVVAGTIPTITPDVDGYFVCSVTVSVVNGAFTLYILDNANNVSFAGDGTSGVLVDWIDVRPANLPAGLPPYQRIAAATDYDTVGFPVYLDIDGTDDNYVTSAINFTGTDKMTIWAGMRKLDDTTQVLCELSADHNANIGSMYLTTGNDASSFYSTTSRGSVGTNRNQAGTFTTGRYPAPDSAVISATHDIAGDLSRIRRNGSSDGAIDGTGDKGTGNFGNYPLYLFSRGGTTLRWKGHFYGLIIRGAATDATQLEQTEKLLNTRMGGIY